MRSKGSVGLRVLGTQAEIAAKFGKDPGYISLLLSGRRRPSKELAHRFAAEGGPPESSWDEPIIDPEVRLPDVTDGPLEPATADDARDLASRLLATAKALETAIAQESSAYERLRYLEKLSSIAVDLGKLTGATIINERMLVNSPGFKRVLAALLESLSPWPDALRAVAEAMKSYE